MSFTTREEEVTRTAIQLRTFIECDRCGTELDRDDDSAETWFQLRHQPPRSSVTAGEGVGDFCSLGCLFDHVRKELAEAIAAGTVVRSEAPA